MRISTPQALWLGFVAAALLFAVLVFDLVDQRQKEFAHAKRQLEQHNRMLAEHVVRTFDSIEVLLDELRLSLNEREHWTEWDAGTGHQFLKSRLSRSLPQIRHLLIFGPDGVQRHTSFTESAPSISVADRPYFRDLANGAERSRHGPYLGRNSNRVTYAFGRRLAGGTGEFAGALVVAIEPDYLANFCGATRPDDDYEAAVISAEGRIIAHCLPAASASAPIASIDDFRRVIAGGSFSDLAIESNLSNRQNRSLMENADHLLARDPVPGYPDLQVLTAVPKARLLGSWQHHARQTLLLGAVGIVLLAFAARIVRRQFQQLVALTRDLREHRDSLEARIRDATRELEAQRSEAERVAAAKSRFLAAASHDLRQPLHALQLFVGDLARGADSPEQRVLVEKIDSAASAMAGQLRNLLELSRLDMASIVAQRNPLSLPDLFDQLGTTYSTSADAAGVRLLLRSRDVTIESDAALLQRLLGNLIDNAIKYAPEGRVLVAARWRANAVRIEVRDNGKGIAPAHQQAIYDEFFQVGNAARTEGAGLGLGLAIAHRIARLLGTSIDLRSRPGEGTVFAITLPCLLRQPRGAAPSATEAVSDDPTLIVLGDPGDFPQRARQWGYSVAIANDVGTAWRLLEKGRAIPIFLLRGSCQLSGEEQSLLRQHRGVVITPAECDMPNLGAYHLREPIKPARLRALLRSLH